MLGLLRKHASNDLAIDLGTANTRVYAREKGIILSEPSVVALREEPGQHPKVAAVGQDAKQMLGKVPGNIRAIKPVKNGVVSDFTVTQEMLRQLIGRTHNSKLFSAKPQVVLCVPGRSSQVERRAIRETAMGAGATTVYLIEAPMAAAVGAGLPVMNAAGSMVVDIGGGTTEIAVISLGGLVYKSTVPVAGDHLDQAIVQFVRRHFGILIGEQTAEAIKKEIGTAFPGLDHREMEVRGRCLSDGIPRSFRISCNEVLEALSEPLGQLIEAIKHALEETPPELSADISESGIMLTGAGATLRNLDRLLMQETELAILIADDPQTCVTRGCGQALEHLDSLGAIFTQE